MSDGASVFTKTRQVAAGGVDTFVAEAGAGTGLPIVFLHGNPDTHDVWAPIVERLAAKYRCIAPDLPGYGASPAPKDLDLSLAAQGAWVKGLLDTLGVERCHLVVHDVGGPHGLSFTAEHAARVRTLTIFNTYYFPDLKWHFWARVWRTPVLGNIAMALGTRGLFVKELRRGSPRMPVEYARKAYAAYTSRTKKHVLRWYRAMDPAVHAGWDEKLLAATQNTPKLVLWGDLDPFLPKQGADRYGATVRHLSDCGHWAMLEEPQIAAQAIDDMVAKNP
jgi:pimeloyl-ACP methyl ester carboxylesterase